MQGRFFVKEGRNMKKLFLLSCLFAASTVLAQDLAIKEIPLERPVPPTPAPTIQKDLPEPVARPADGVFDDLYTLVEEQKKAIRDLTERLEQAEHGIKQNEEKLERVNQDLAFRLTELENKPAVTIDKSSDKERYEYAYNLVQQKNYKQAEEQLLAFLKDFENSDLRPNALYWLGETYYTQGLYEQAVGQFSDIFTTYPNSTKAADSLLKLGLSMAALNNQKEACVAFLALLDKYPKAQESLKKRAKEEAEKYKCS